MRIGNRSRGFWPQGKPLFGKKDNTLPTDETSNAEVENTLLSETAPDNNGDNKEQSSKTEFGIEVIELGKNISFLLTELKKFLEEGKVFPNSRDWVGSAMSILGKCVDIASAENQKDLKKLFLDMARVIYSSDRVGKVSLSIDPVLELYSFICGIVTDFIRGKPDKKMFEQWSTIYQRVVNNLNNLGIRLVDDDEEPIATTIKEADKDMKQTASKITNSNLTEKSAEHILPETTDFNSNTLDTKGLEIPQTDVFLQGKEAVENPMESSASFYEENKSEAIQQTEETVSTEIIESTPELEISEEKGIDEESKQSTNYTTVEEAETASVETYTTEIEPTSAIPPEPQKKRVPVDINFCLQYINQIPNNEVKEKLLDTLEAIAGGTPEIAKMKALELATEMAKLEVDKVKKDCRSIELQIDSLTSEVNQVEGQLQICQTEINTTHEELKEQESLAEKSEKEKEKLEKNISDTSDKIAEIDRKIQELQKQKELELKNLKGYEENFISTEKMIEEYNKSISSLKETIQDLENQATTLVQRMDSLESMKTEKNSQLEKLEKQIKEKEDIVQHLERTIKVLQPLSNSTQNTGIDETNIQNDADNSQATIDLFNEKV
ncbi:MAG TPA: hypothetical protein PLX23_06895 [Candidatus Hydrogenedens sp.]|nr:hypothetical protein [Candidatus Hydrogenedens sp.]